MPTSLRTFLATALLVTLAHLSAAHSWIEEYQVISQNGSYVGQRGYSRGYVSRDDPTYNGFSMMWMLPSLEARNQDGTVRTRIDKSDLLCHPAQRTSNYTATYPKLQVQPGDYVAMKYLENGHVTLPWNITGKPPGSGNVFVFGTTNPSPTEKIAEVMQWNRGGTSGNKKGFLMTAQSFDDGRCHQLNCGSISQQRQFLMPNHVADQPTSTVESWCETDLKIPESVKAGTLTTYWVWQFGTEPNMDCNAPAGKDEYYTTCADFEVIADGNAGAAPADVKNKLALSAPFSAAPGANPQSIAVSNYKSRTAIVATPAPALMEHNKVAGAAIATVDSAFASACSEQASVISAYSLALWPEVFVPNTCSVISSFGRAAATAAEAQYDILASAYAAESSSAWQAAFAAANLPQPTPRPWNSYPIEDRVPTGGNSAAPSTTAQPSQTTSSPAVSTPAAAPPYANSSKASSGNEKTSIRWITATTMVTITATQEAPLRSETTPLLASPPSSSASVAEAQTDTPAANPYSISTILTMSGTSPSSAPTAPPSGSVPIVPSVGTSGLVGRRRVHARNFSDSD